MSAHTLSPREPRAADGRRRKRVLLWHVHGAWATAFVHGEHDYTVPVLPDRGPDGVLAALDRVVPERVGVAA